MKMPKDKNIPANMERNKPLIGKWEKQQIEWILICLFLFCYALAALSQTGFENQEYHATSQFVPTIKDARKFSELPEIRDSVKKIENIKYGITSSPVISKYQAQRIEAAKLQNEPLGKLYHSLLRVGYAPIYNMPLGELWIANARSKEMAYGAHLKHLHSSTHLRDVGFGGFSDSQGDIFGKKFYKKHTLSGDFNYERNVIHHYGYDTTLNKLDPALTRQRYQFFEPKVRLVSHFNDSTHINHYAQLSYYNLQNLQKESENNIRFEGSGSMFINKENFHIDLLTDYYNNKQVNDTFNDLIITLSPSFVAKGKKWNALMGVAGTLDNLKNVSRFYFYPQLHLDYDIYQSLVIPYAGVNGGLQKNSFRSLTRENPFLDSTFRYQNTSNNYNLFGGLRGQLSSKTSYDARVTYSRYRDLHFFMMDYSNPDMIYNRFKVVYDNASMLAIGGQLKYQAKEKLNISARGNYYIYTTDTLERAYHKPDYDVTLSAIYNMQSKIILKADLFFFGKQWALSPADDGSGLMKPKQIAGWADLNLEAEYRYSKMLSFFVRFNNIANQRYYRWDRYPSQRFNFMLGLTFVPF